MGLFLLVGTYGLRGAIAETCVSNAYYRVCAAWSFGNPSHTTDFLVTFHGSDPPDIELITGDDEWVIYVQNVSDDSPGDVGTISLDPTTPYENYVIKLANGATPGINNVDEIDLIEAGWYGNAAFAEDSVIGGNLNGDLTTDSALWLIINGDVSLSSTVTTPGTLLFWVFGDFGGRLEVTDDSLGNTSLYTLSGTVDFNNNPIYAELTLPHGGSGDIVNGGEILANSFINLSSNSGYPFSGTLTLSGVDGYYAVGTIAFTELTGTIHVTGDMDGDIIGTTGGLSDGALIQIDGNMGGAIEFSGSGTAEGEIHIGGDVLSIVDRLSFDIAGTLGGDARISIDGSLSNLYGSSPISGVAR